MSANPVSNGENSLLTRPRKAAREVVESHRALPYSLEAEKGFLASILLSPRDLLDEYMDQVSREHFHDLSHASVFEVLVDLWKESKPIDFITLTQHLRDRGLLEKVGGAEGITDIYTYVPTAANADYYLSILKEKALLRQMISVCTEYASRSYEEQGDALVLLDEVEAKILAIGQDRHRGELPPIGDHVNAAVDAIERIFKNRGAISGLPTGFSKLDQLTTGLHEGEMIVVAARPSMGKTAFAMNIVEHVAVELGKPVGVFSLEMSSQQLTQRLLCSLARVDMQKVRDGFLSAHDVDKIAASAGRLSETSIYIDDTPSLKILDFRARARRMRERHGVELIAIDYLQLLRSHSKRAQENRQIEIAEISSAIKGLAKELKIPIIVLAQLNRKPDERGGGLPRMSDLRESGSIEQDADVVGLLVRSEVYETDEAARAEKAGEAELIIAKQRNGPVGQIALTFLKEFTRFEDRASEKSGHAE